MKLKNIKLLSIQENRKMVNMAHQPPQQKNDTVYKEDKSRENVVKESNTSIISAKNNIDTVDKAENNKHPKKQLIPPKKT